MREKEKERERMSGKNNSNLLEIQLKFNLNEIFGRSHAYLGPVALTLLDFTMIVACTCFRILDNCCIRCIRENLKWLQVDTPGQLKLSGKVREKYEFSFQRRSTLL